MERIVAATTNKGKLREIKEILKDFEVLSLEDLNCNIDVEEDGNTFCENALKKAREISKHLGMSCIADDSGLCIEEFNGWPGIMTARFLGEGATPEEKNEFILDKMKGLPKERRKANHTVSVAYVPVRGEEIVVEASHEGYIAEEPRGNNGFGFDVIFELDDRKNTS